MAVKNMILILIIYYMFNTLEAQTTDGGAKTTNNVDLVYKGEYGTCKTTISTCKITRGDLDSVINIGPKGDRGERGETGPQGESGQKGDVGAMGPKGDSGEKGDVGSPGPRGIPGEKGDTGIPGKPGSQGPKGSQGLKGDTGTPGDKGFKGEMGISGPKGSTGLQGPPGLKGDMGLPGEKGQKGDMGPIGPPGPPGMPGTPGIAERTGDKDDEYPDSELETKDELILKTTCEFAHVKSGTYILGGSSPFEAYCNMTNSMTCIYGKGLTDDITSNSYSVHDPSLNIWLSQYHRFNIEKLYGLKSQQINWLQHRSTSAQQIIRIYAKNFVPYNKITRKHIHLLTWNDQVIGPLPTTETPHFYHVPEKLDKCSLSTNSTKWCTTDIIITSASNRLPIRDVRLSDIRNDEEQYIYLEHVELCYR